jgi:UDP-3-O-[3-hydroxymyristoyl] N-acetylglucosamine deacetylase / 3-hydroxyacyl-[acyl-carrier-protein] dehydratase
MIKQRTISRPVSVAGKGLHTGEIVTLTFKPAPENHGFIFKRIDLENQPLVHARLENVVDTSRGTTIEENGVRVCTVEHTLAALAGLSLDNILIELDSVETPILDGSSLKFIETLLQAGIVEQEAPKVFIELKTNLEYIDAERNVEMIAIPADDFRITTMIDYETNVLGTQFANLDHIEDFKTEISPCRTFVFLHELEYLLEKDLIKGGDMNNAIVFINRIISQEELDRLAVVFNKPKVSVLKEGILNNLELHFPNEPARHKLLDVIGDLALLGGTLKAHIITKRPGHYSNINFAKKIAEQIDLKPKSNKKSHTEVFDLTKPPLYDINQIQKIIPHRPPFLLIDKILEMDEQGIIGLKNVTMNESFFVGHFPDEPIMPGVLQIEAMAQCGGIFALSTVPDPENYLTLFLKIEQARFKNKVVPGDTIVFKIKLNSPIRRGICQMTGYAYVNNQIVMEAELLAQIVKKVTK